MDRPSGVSSASEASCAASASSSIVDARRGNELGRHAVAERDRAGLVEQQHVHVAGGLDGAAARGQHVAAHQAVHAGDADGAQQAADGRRNQADEQRQQHGQRRQHHAGLTGGILVVPAYGGRVTTTRMNSAVRLTSRMFSAISFGVFWRRAPSISAIMRSRNDGRPRR